MRVRTVRAEVRYTNAWQATSQAATPKWRMLHSILLSAKWLRWIGFVDALALSRARTCTWGFVWRLTRSRARTYRLRVSPFAWHERAPWPGGASDCIPLPGACLCSALSQQAQRSSTANGRNRPLAVTAQAASSAGCTLGGSLVEQVHR